MSNQEAGIGIEAAKKTSVTSLASTASSWSDSPYIRLMTDSARKRSESSQTSVEIEKRSRKVSENPSQSDLIEINEPEVLPPMPKSPKVDKKTNNFVRNLPFVTKAKVQNVKMDAAGGSKVFEMYTAQIKE